MLLLPYAVFKPLLHKKRVKTTQYFLTYPDPVGRLVSIFNCMPQNGAHNAKRNTSVIEKFDVGQASNNKTTKMLNIKPDAQ